MKNKLSILIGGVLVAFLVALVALVIGATSAYAQGPADTLMHGRGPGGGRGFGLAGLQVAAEALDMTTDELITELRSGKTLDEIAEEAGVPYEDVQAAIQEARQTEFRDRIQQALDDGTITQAHADWLLEGLEQGFIGGGHGFGFGGGHGPGSLPEPEAQPTTTSG